MDEPPPGKRKTTEEGGDRLEPTDPIAQLRHLNELRDQGILSDEEFAAEKAKLLQ